MCSNVFLMCLPAPFVIQVVPHMLSLSLFRSLFLFLSLVLSLSERDLRFLSLEKERPGARRRMRVSVYLVHACERVLV